MEEKDIIEAIYSAVDATNDQLPKDQQLDRSPETILFGRGGRLDSLGLVSFIIEVEQELADKLGLSITLADDRAMSQKNSPFLTIRTLTDYVKVLADENDGRN